MNIRETQREIERLQELQKRHPPNSPMWKEASEKLQPLFERMASLKKPAFPMAVPELFAFADAGLSRRELFAMAAMAGIITTDGRVFTLNEDDVARDAVNFADALIAQLDE